MPGNPTSCLSNAYVLLVPFLRAVARLPKLIEKTVRVPLGRRIVSQAGRLQFYTVRLENGVAMPAFKGSGEITSLSQADGYIQIPAGPVRTRRREPRRCHAFLESSSSALAALLLTCAHADAQWFKLTTPNVPRTSDGKLDAKAPPPRVSGAPDLSGLWRYEADPYTNNVVVDLKAEEIKPEVVALYKQRQEDLGKDDPSTFRCLPSGPRSVYAPPGFVRIVQTPTVIAMIYEDLHLPTDIHGRASAAERSESEFHGLLRRALGRRHARGRERRLQRSNLARFRRPSAHRSAEDHRAHQADQLRAARHPGPARRPRALHPSDQRARSRGVRRRHRDARVRLQRKPEGRRTPGRQGVGREEVRRQGRAGHPVALRRRAMRSSIRRTRTRSCDST